MPSAAPSAEETPLFGLADLPSDCLVRCLVLVDYQSVLACGATCRRLREVAGDQAIWRAFLHRDWDAPVVEGALVALLDKESVSNLLAARVQKHTAAKWCVLGFEIHLSCADSFATFKGRTILLRELAAAKPPNDDCSDFAVLQRTADELLRVALQPTAGGAFAKTQRALNRNGVFNWLAELAYFTLHTITRNGRAAPRGSLVHSAESIWLQHTICAAIGALCCRGGALAVEGLIVQTGEVGPSTAPRRWLKQSHVLRGMLAPSRIWDIAERAALLPTNDPMIPIVSPLEAPRTAPPEAAASASAASESGGAGSGAGQATGVGSFLSGPMSAGGVPGESALTADLEALRGVAVPLRAISALGFAPLAATMWAGPELLGEDGMNDGLEIGGDPAAAGAAGEPGAVVPLAAAAAAAQTLGMDLYDLVASTEASASAWGPLAAEGSAQASARAVIQRVLLLELAVAAGAPRVANGAAERSYCLPLMHMAVGRWPCGGRPPHGSRAARARREALPGAGPSLLTGAWTGRRFGSGFAPSVQKSWLGLSVSSDGLVTGVARDEVGTMQVTGWVNPVEDERRAVLPPAAAEFGNGAVTGVIRLRARYTDCGGLPGALIQGTVPGAQPMVMVGYVWPFGIAGVWRHHHPRANVGPGLDWTEGGVEPGAFIFWPGDKHARRSSC